MSFDFSPRYGGYHSFGYQQLSPMQGANSMPGMGMSSDLQVLQQVGSQISSMNQSLMQLGQVILAMQSKGMLNLGSAPTSPQTKTNPWNDVKLKENSPKDKLEDVETDTGEDLDADPVEDEQVNDTDKTDPGTGGTETGTVDVTATDDKQGLAKSLENIDYNDVKQAGHGDCVFEAALASVATTESGKKQISEMVKNNKDGTYTVTFPGDNTKPVTVNEDEIKNLKSNNKNGWARIIETAFVKGYPEQAKADFPKQLNGKDATPAQQMLHLLTGKDAPKAEATDNDIDTKLDTELNKNHKSVIVFCANDADKALTSGHEWTVTKYDPATKTITVRNPWGHSNLKPGETKNGMTGLENGQVQMSLEDFKKYYKEVTFA